MNKLVRSATIVTVLSATVLGACRKKQPAAAPAPAPSMVNQDSIDAARRAREEADRRAAADRMRADSIANANAMRERMMNEARSALTAAVYFEYDAATITGDARAVLEAIAASAVIVDERAAAGEKSERESEEAVHGVTLISRSMTNSTRRFF